MTTNGLDDQHSSGYPLVANRRQPEVILANPVTVAGPMRILLLVLGVCLIGVYAIAAWLHPYNAAGEPLLFGTHHQLGLAPCGYFLATQKPCPACGLTTSFSLLLHGEIHASLRANWVGTVMALAGFPMLPWSLWIAYRGRNLVFRDVERSLLLWGGILLILLLLRWGMIWFG